MNSTSASTPATGDDPSSTFQSVLHSFGQRFLWAAAYFSALLLLGSVGCLLIEGWNWFDAVYMAAITITAVGFMEVHTLSDSGRAFTMLLLDAATFGADITLRLEQATISSRSKLVGKTLADAKIPQKTGLIVLALRAAGSHAPSRYNPGPETRLEPGDEMIVLGSQEQIERLRAYVNS